MSATSKFYLAQAALCAQAAQKASLPNEKERSLRSEAAWLVLAEKLIRAEENREKLDAEKALLRTAAVGRAAFDRDDCE